MRGLFRIESCMGRCLLWRSDLISGHTLSCRSFSPLPHSPALCTRPARRA